MNFHHNSDNQTTESIDIADMNLDNLPPLPTKPPLTQEWLHNSINAEFQGSKNTTRQTQASRRKTMRYINKCICAKKSFFLLSTKDPCYSTSRGHLPQWKKHPVPHKGVQDYKFFWDISSFIPPLMIANFIHLFVEMTKKLCTQNACSMFIWQNKSKWNSHWCSMFCSIKEYTQKECRKEIWFVKKQFFNESTFNLC